MASIDRLKTLIHQNISDGRYNMPVVVNEMNKSPLNGTFLFYGADNDILQIGRTVTDGYYSNEISITCRHAKYETARIVAYKTLEYISKNRKLSGVIFIPEEPPIYTGIDDTGGYTWSFIIKAKGGE